MILRLSMRYKMLLWLLASLALMAAVFSYLIVRTNSGFESISQSVSTSMTRLSEDALRRRAETLVRQLSENLTNPMYYMDFSEIGEHTRVMLRQADVIYIIVFDEKGQIIHDGSGQVATYGEKMQDAMAYEAGLADGLHFQSNRQLIDATMPIKIGGRKLGGVRVGLSRAGAVAASQSLESKLTERLSLVATQHVQSLLIAFAIFIVLGVLVIIMLRRQILIPLRNLSSAAEMVEVGRYEDVHLQSNRNDEIGDLVRAFSRMSKGVAKHEREVRRLAYVDALTGLGNRLSFRESLESRLLTQQAASGELALLFVDLDDFKRVNDTMGHEAGDHALVQIASRIRMVCDRLVGNLVEVARLGGDEFVVLFSSSDIHHSAGRLAESLIDEVQRPLIINGRQVFLGTSIGITIFPHDAESASLLLKSGDIAMYQAKVAGKNCYRYYSKAMDEAVERRMQLEHDLRGAAERGEISMMYQPLFSLADGRVVGAEALMRWRHPRLGLVSPSVFIDVAEQSGQVEGLGRLALEEACAAAALWNCNSGAAPFISVNVSPRQLRSSELPELVARILAQSKLRPEQLHLELTETAVLGDEAQASVLLTKLRATGVKVWLDDFGTGFSGLSHLRRVPVDGVKIDRSFIADVLRDPDDLALTSAVIAMAHSLGITVVAEGIETEGQHSILRDRGCDLGQGFWLGRPMSADDMGSLFS